MDDEKKKIKTINDSAQKFAELLIVLIESKKKKPINNEEIKIWKQTKI
jgi:hypothetical protein